MPLRPLNQTSFFDPEFACPDCLDTGTVPWLLARFRSKVFPAWLFVGWRGGGRGRNAWPAVVLMTLVLLRWTEEGMSRRASVKRARKDAEWRAALGIALDGAVPSERTLRDFESFMARQHREVGQPRYLLFLVHVVRLCVGAGIVDNDAVWAGDSTPMWCYGAVRDTVRLLGDGLRMLGRQWAKATRRSFEAVAASWELPWLLAKSTKGGLNVDWRDADARAEAVSRLAGDTVRVVEQIRKRLEETRPSFRKGLLRRLRALLQVVGNDLEADEEGRLVVARHVASDRLVSMTDPQARHGRKSKSQTFKGFKLHLVGDVVSGLIASLTVAPGNVHDNRPAPRLIRRAKELFDSFERFLGDTAYGAAELRVTVRDTLGVEILAPPPPARRSTKKLFVKSDFIVDLDAWTATCPNDVTTDEWTTVRSDGKTRPRFAWPAQACKSCPLHEQCLGKQRGRRRLILHQYERELRALRAEWDKPETRRAYRIRSQCERLVHSMTRHGARRARAWGLRSANFQAHAIAAVVNLGLLAKAYEDSG
ncbi:MAG: transposase [Deltaproteobacteria bacterium]|jgi:hypothetical protein|nr:transposase [Deltaproteobacteria bacterium]